MGKDDTRTDLTDASDQAEAFEDLAAPHLGALLRTAQRLTLDHSDAEDLVQDALLKGFRFFDRFEEGTNFKAWIFKIMTNSFVNTYRRKQRQGPQLNMEVAEQIEAPDGEVAEIEGISDPEQRQMALLELVDDRIRTALLELPEHLRIVFMLAVVEDLKYREISDILDCPVGTVMSRLFRARSVLKERLAYMVDESQLQNEEPKS